MDTPRQRLHPLLIGTLLALLAYGFFAWIESRRGRDWASDPPRFGPAPSAP
jgi:hypothetical protein